MAKVIKNFRELLQDIEDLENRFTSGEVSMPPGTKVRYLGLCRQYDLVMLGVPVKSHELGGEVEWR